MKQQSNFNHQELSKSEKPLVTIVVITYNSAKFVIETLESAKAQTYKNIELVVSDDCSTDDTVEICKEWILNNKERFANAEIITAPVNTGIPANHNRGIKAAKGEWIKGIAGDDALMVDCIKCYIEFIHQNPFVEVLHSKVTHFKDYLNEDNRLPDYNSVGLKINQPGNTAKEQFEILLRDNKIWAASLMIKRSVYEKVGYYDENLRLWEDRPMLLKLTQNNIKLHFVNFVSCKYRVNVNSIQRRKSNDKLVTDFTLEMNKYYYKNYLKFLPPLERIIRGIHIKRILFLDKFDLNKNIKILKVYLVLTAFPWTLFLKQINRRYF